MLGTARSLEPAGVLTHMARVLDAHTPATEFEAALDVELLAIDATSYRVIREHCDADPERMASMIAAIVAERGKLENPWTGSGGVLMGRVSAVGSRYTMTPLRPGDRVVPLVSLITVPLRLDSVGPVDPVSSLVPVRGSAIVTGRMVCGHVPEDLSPSVTIRAFDVYPSASHARSFARAGDHVLVLGAGHAGLLAVAAAREAVGDGGLVTVVDRSRTALERASTVDGAVAAIESDVTDPLAVAGELARRGLPRAALTLLCTSVPGGEGTALLATDERGIVLFFSTATRFAAAGLGADAIGSQPQLIIPNGLTDDRGEYALELLRRTPALLRAFED